MITEQIKLKEHLKDKAKKILSERITNASNAMQEAQLAANNEEKSTVGDKHETSRSMALMDREIFARQLDAAQKELSVVMKCDVTMPFNSITNGAYVETDKGNYF